MNIVKQFLITLSLAGWCLVSASTLAAGANVEFSSLVSAVDATGDYQGTVTVTLHGIEVTVAINGDTEIESGGEEIALVDISAGDFVKVEAFFSDQGIVADEIEVLDSFKEHFRFRGTLQGAVSGDGITTITVMGVDINADENTKITRRRSGQGNQVPASELAAGDAVNILGSYTDNQLWADRIHVGTRTQGDIEIDGTISELGENSLVVEIEGGGTATVNLDPDTQVSGELVLDAYVEVEGQLQEGLAILAFEIVVDTDGDGDADDDNRRIKRKDKRGGGDSDDVDRNFEGSEIVLLSETDTIRAKAEFKYETEDGEIEQEFEVKLEDGEPDASYSILVFFSDTQVDFGTLSTDDSGSGELEIESDKDEDSDQNLSDLLPEGLDVRNITAVQILLNGEIILDGDF